MRGVKKVNLCCEVSESAFFDSDTFASCGKGIRVSKALTPTPGVILCLHCQPTVVF